MNENETKFEVQIVELKPMRCASFYAYSTTPEMDAWAKLAAWAGPRGLLEEGERRRIFGFDNPNPAPGSPKYGYEYWVEVGPDVEPEDEMRIVYFDGGLYAVAPCPVRGNAYEVIPATWQKLVAWRETSPYRSARHQWMEKHIRNEDPGNVFDLELYLPIAK